jgi:hypothetical protein
VYWSAGPGQWKYVCGFKDFPTPNDGDWVTLYFPKTVYTNGIHVVANRLGQDESNNYVFQLGEVGAGCNGIFSIAESTGGAVNFTLDAGSSNAWRNYYILGSVSGTNPGKTLPGGKATLPLNFDIFTNFVISLMNTPIFSNFMGNLDGLGLANAKFDTIAPFSGATGITLYFAYALNNPWDFASNPLGILIIP